MMLIAFEIDGGTAVMHYLGEDTSREAIDFEMARSGHGRRPWRTVTRDEYAAILAARPKPQVPDVIEATDLSGVNEAIRTLASAIGAVNAKADLAHVKIEAAVDTIERTDISGDA